jgi:hypothetical protein
MGLFGGLFGGAQCLLGFHEWREWAYSTPANCSQTRTCRRGCGQTEKRVSHDWPGFTHVSDHSCEKARTCKRCSLVEKDKSLIIHNWSSFEYIKDGSCEQQRNCQRCSATEKRMADHVYSPWVYVGEGDCTETCECTRCHELRRRMRHQWGCWEFSSPTSCRKVKACRRCGEEEEQDKDEIQHQWGVWEFENPRSCQQVRFCRKCHEGREVKEPKWEDHDWSDPVRLDCRHTVSKCHRCGKQVRNNLPYGQEQHIFGPWTRRTEPGYLPSRKCEECGFSEVNRPSGGF